MCYTPISENRSWNEIKQEYQVDRDGNGTASLSDMAMIIKIMRTIEIGDHNILIYIDISIEIMIREEVKKR